MVRRAEGMDNIPPPRVPAPQRGPWPPIFLDSEMTRVTTVGRTPLDE